MIALQESQLEPGDVLLYRAANTWGNAMSVLIRKLDGTEVSHAGLYMGDGLVGESLIMGNTGLNTNPLAESVAGCNWVEVRRLPSATDRRLVLDTAWRRLKEGNCYGFDQILLVAGICLTRKIDFRDGLLRTIVEAALTKASNFVRSMIAEGREPMICSEFVFRSYDEADAADDDPYTLSILSQSAQQERRRWTGRRTRERIFGSEPETHIPTIHPESLLAEQLRAPAHPRENYGAAAIRQEVSDAELDALIYAYVNTQPEGAAFTSATSEISGKAVSDSALHPPSKTQIDQSAADLIEAMAEAPTVDGGYRLACGLPSDDAYPAVRVLPVIADFVTPGDLLQTPSLRSIGRLFPS